MKKNVMQNIAIILKPSKIDDLNNILTNLVRWLMRRDKKIFLLISEEKRLQQQLTPKTLKSIEFVDSKFIYNQSDLILSLGGDGTLLGVCRNANSKIPIFGVNLGRLGFITEFIKKDFYENLNTVLIGKYDLFKKQLYSVNVLRKGKTVQKEYFFNDAVFTKNDIARMFTLNVEANHEHVYDISGDGLIISSTYGSTAYSLAAGGPIVHPEVKAFIMTPICAHSLTHRPLVIPDDKSLQVKVLENIDTVNITLDVQTCIHLEPKDFIQIKRETRKSISLVKNPDRTYFHTLKEKFVHGRREVY